MPDKNKKALFSLCTFTIVPNKELTDAVIDTISSSIIRNGGSVVLPKRDGSLPLAEVTHVIANTIDFPQFAEANAMMVPVVKSLWITASLAKGKQMSIRPYTPDPRMIFSEVVLSCADIPPSDKDAIIGATMAMGGVYTDSITKATTHVCALSMDHEKCQAALKDHPKRCKIVLPHWFDDCFKLGKRIDETPYQLPDPEYLRAHPQDDVRVPSSQHLEGATSAQPDYPPAPAGDRPTLQVFKGKKIMLSADLSIPSRLWNIIRELIISGGGDLTEDVDECEWFICQFRDGPQYVRASQAEKTVGNLSWLFYLITHDEWTSPLRRLLHYPVPRHGIPGFKDKMITVSNYGGEARIYLENLVIAAGATFTKTMKADNTHLITARDNSEKCVAAAEWNIDMVNHLWIEESYAKCEMQSVTVPRFTHFPPRTNLGEIIGQTFLDESKLRAVYYPGSPEPQVSGTKRKRKILEMADENSFSEGPAEGVVIGRQAHKEFDVMKDSEKEYAQKTTETFGVPAPPKRRSSEFATPARGRHVRTGKENETPSSDAPSSRSAKDKALRNLSVQGADKNLYDKEKKRGHKDGIWGGKRAADRIEREHLNRRSVSSPTTGEEDQENAAKAAKRPTKRARPTLREVEMRVSLTGFKRWVNDKHKEDADRKKLRDMGIAVVSDNQPCDYLVAPQIVRTVKFLQNLSRGATILSSTWIEECLDTKQVPDPDMYVLKDKESEKKFGMKLENSVRRARQHNGKLLWNVPIYCTSNIKNGITSYKAIAESNGALFMVYAARSGTTIKPTRPEEDESGPEPVYLLSTATPEEKKLWKKFEDMARKGNMEPRVVASDWLLDVVMRQEVAFDEKYLVSNFF
ncbi:BRCT domain-containing protein [Xylariomycetidae sp. FL2044]|nr:BRCT domain-containing protein [Xylariomycetidae sp. FL2044]